MTDTVGLFGLGLIGKSLATRLLAAGRCVVGHDPNPNCMQEFEALRGVAATQNEVWQSCVVLAAVFDTDQLETLIDEAPHTEGVTLISTSTCDPERMPGLAVSARKKAITLIEAPLSGTSHDLVEGNAVFLVGGAPAEIAPLEWLWPLIGRNFYHMGALGNGNRAKLAINLVLGLNRAALAEGLVYAQRIGIAPSDFLPLLKDTAAYSTVMDSKGPKMVNGDFAPLGRIAQSQKDFRLIAELAQAQGQHLPFATTYSEMMDIAVERGDGDLDNAAIIRAIENAKRET